MHTPADPCNTAADQLNFESSWLGSGCIRDIVHAVWIIARRSR
jgi:hypothetical protein